MFKIHLELSDQIYQKAADRLTQVLEEKVIERRKVLLLLSGGSCLNIYQKLSENIRTSKLPWHLVTIAQVDERFHPNDYSEINAKSIEKTGLGLVMREKNMPYFTVSQRGTLAGSTVQYNHNMSKLFHDCQFRASVMGIGEDGHTAGLLPGFEKKWNTDKFAVGYKNPGKFKQRVSITPIVIKQLDYTLILLAGETKKNILKRFVKSSKNEPINDFPAIVLKSIKKIDIFTDIKNH